MPLADLKEGNFWGVGTSRHFQPVTAETVLTESDTRRLEGQMRKMFGLRASECVGHVSTETPPNTNFEYPTWLKRMMH